ncbi:sensor histidine kinase [Cohnella sp.]|uniref:cache domain-containing sensor histidine kinase n=1 Tax=Cohnella sp. TaxID=1883426 RepID=UPI0035670F10
MIAFSKTMRLIRQSKIATQLSLLLLLMIVLPLLLVTFFSMRTYNSVLLEQIISRTTQSLEQVSYSVDLQTNRFVHTLASISNSEDVITDATGFHRSSDIGLQFINRKKLDQRISSFFHYTPDLVSVKFYYHDGSVYDYKQILNSERLQAGEDWYERTKRSNHKVIMFGAEDMLKIMPQGGYELSASVAPGYGPPFSDVDIIQVFLNGNSIQKLVESRQEDTGQIYVLDGQGAVVTSGGGAGTRDEAVFQTYLNNALLKPDGHYVTEINHTKSFVVFLTSDSGWKYIQVLPYERVVNQIDKVARTTLIVLGLAIAVFSLASLVLVRSIVKPIGSLIQQMNRMKSGNLDVRIEEAGPLEMKVLGASFNDMVTRIRELVNERELKEMQRNRAEIDALQSQINPHFLLNTLNTIKLMARMTQARNIEQMTVALTRMLSSAFNRGGSYTKVEEELGLLDHYFHIMKIRYGDIFDFEYAIDPDIRQLYMLRLMLQPIVENAVIHGIHGMAGRGRITINGVREDERTIRFEIQDNGSGIAQSKLAELHNPSAVMEGFSGLGMRNVIQRIKLNYGEKYGLIIQSESDQGTKVIMTLPVLEKPEE